MLINPKKILMEQIVNVPKIIANDVSQNRTEDKKREEGT
jgi:hypothetical protein